MRTFSRMASLGLLFGLLLFLALTIQIEARPEPPYPSPAPPPMILGQEPMIQAVAVPTTGGSPLRGLAAAPCIGGACPAISVECNTVITWTNDIPNQWNTYNCLDTNIFDTLPYSETFYSIEIDALNHDLSLAIPKSLEDPGTLLPMNSFGAILNTCDSDDCLAATHTKGGLIYQHAIVPNAPLSTYTMTIDSPHMDGSGDAIIACGSHETGWCEGVISTTFQCGNFSFHDNTNNGQDDIIYYGTNYAFDGKEMTYKLVLTDTRVLTFTLHYSGNPNQDYNNYMGLFVLPDTCHQRTLVGYTGLAGETGYTSRTTAGLLAAGTYYLVVDGMHMPYGGDPFQVDVGCSGPLATPRFVYLPIVYKNY